jgi:hypothetical protein
MHFVLSRKEKTKRNARLAMSPWYLEDSQLHNTIKYASSISFGKKTSSKKRKRERKGK